MKVLVSTKETQGDNVLDFCFVPDGELVGLFLKTKHKEIGTLSGIKCRTTTTTFKVVDMDITPDEYLRMITESQQKAGFHTEAAKEFNVESDQDVADFVLKGIEDFQVGDVLGITLDYKLYLRREVN